MLVAITSLLASACVIDLVSARRPSIWDQTAPEFDCFAGGWVRAPDLYPGLSTSADARLHLNGTHCDQIVGWQVGLRYKERSILKFAATNVTIPEEPRWSSDSMRQQAVEEDIPAILGSQMYFSGEDDQYSRSMKEYREKLKNESLWVIRAAEREVFDSRIELVLRDDDSSATIAKDHDFYAVRNFHVHVPLTNYPPQLANFYEGGHDGDHDRANSETMFEYYFTLTTSNGTEIDVVAGQSAFLPVAVSGDHNERQLSTSARNITLGGAGKRPDDLPEFVQNSDWPPRCDDGGDANFTVSLIIPDSERLEANASHSIRVRVDKVGNSTEYPTHIRLGVSPCRANTWALQYATGESQRKAADNCESAFGYMGSYSYRFMNDGESGRLMQRESMMELCGPDPSKVIDSDDRDVGPGGMTSCFSSTFSGPPSSGTALDQEDWRMPMDVVLNVFNNATPSFNGTFSTLKNSITVTLFTRFTCDQEPAGGHPAEQKPEAVDENAWASGPRYHGHSSPYPVRSRRVHSGLVPVTIVSSTNNAAGHVIPYTDPDAQAIVLSSQPTPPGSFPLTNTTWQTDFADRELVTSKYSIYERRSACQGPRCISGGSYALVSDAWARKGCAKYWAERQDA